MNRMRTEELKIEDSTDTVIAEIRPLGWRLISQLKQKFMKINEIVPEGDGIKSMRGDFNFEGIAEASFDKGVKCERKEEVDSLEMNRVYNKYYSKYFNPNHQEESTEKKS